VTDRTVGYNALLADDFIQPFNYLIEFFWGNLRNSLSETLERKSTYLADLDPGPLRKAWACQLKRERESGSLRLTAQSHRNDDAGPFVEDILTENEDRSLPRLFVPLGRVEIGPVHFAS
jgi:hypothetical protein